MATTIIGDRNLASITDEELHVFLDMTGEYGCKEYWGEPVITHIDRNRHKDCITVWFSQTRERDGETSDSFLDINLNSLTYYASFFYPFERMQPTHSVLEKPKLFLFLLRQGFNVMELLPEESYISKNRGISCKAAGYVFCDNRLPDVRFLTDEDGQIVKFNNDHAHDAIVKQRELDEDEYNHYRLYSLVPVEEPKPRIIKCQNNAKTI